MINHWIFRCRDISYLISQSMDRKLPLRIRMGIKIHLMMCDLCLRYKKQLELIHNAISKIKSDETLAEILNETPDETPDELITPLPEQVKKKIRDRLKDL